MKVAWIEVAERLEARFGLVVSGRDLVRLLGYRTGAAFRQAVRRRSLGISTFFISGRRGRAALTIDVARWVQARTVTEGEMDG